MSFAKSLAARPALLAAAVVVVLLLLLVVVYSARPQPGWAHLDYWKAHFVESPDQIYARSAGGYDDAADLALRRTEGARAPAPADHHRAATIIHRNIVAQEHRPRAGGPDGAPPPDARELARLRHGMFGRARDHHTAALAGLTDAAIARDEADRAVRRYGLAGGEEGEDEGPEAPPRGEVPGRPGAVFIIDAALEFAYGGGEVLAANDPVILAAILAEAQGVGEWGGLEVRAAGGEPGFYVVGGGLLAAAARGRREASVLTRLAAAEEVAAAAGGGPGTRVAAFLDLSTRHTSDPQNSHDSSVNAAKRATVARLREDQGACDRLPTLGQIAAEINAGGAAFSRDPRTGAARPALVEKAVAVVERARDGDRSSSAAASDEEVLRRVWARADDGRNAEKRSQLRQAAFDALVDCWERGIGVDQIQCVDGRIGRMLGALVWLDHDEANWQLRRLEQHKNEIFEEAARVIRAAAEEAAGQTADAGLRAAGLAYLASTPAELARAGVVDAAAERAWVEDTRARVALAVDARIAALERAAPGTVPAHAAEGIKKEALAALW